LLGFFSGPVFFRLRVAGAVFSGCDELAQFLAVTADGALINAAHLGQVPDGFRLQLGKIEQAVHRAQPAFWAVFGLRGFFAPFRPASG